MKQLTCEMCGSTDLVKQDGMYVCQSCGTKYSVEEAKKMMIEGTVDVSGSTVKVDTSNELSNLYQIARRARDNNDTESAARYYDMILMKDPNSWEATFYAVYFKAKGCKIAAIESAAISISNCFETVMMLIKNNVKTKDAQLKAIDEIGRRSMELSVMLYKGAITHYNGIDYQIKSNYLGETTARCRSALQIPYSLGDSIDSVFGSDENVLFRELAVSIWEAGISFNTTAKANGWGGTVTQDRIERIRKYKPNYQPPVVQSPSSSTGGCYVATAVYGSYDCPQVWTLRRYRDYTLAETWYGRAFIRTYYAVSPTLVKWFGHTNWFKNMWKPKLDRLVEKLNQNGVDSTPYQDRNW